MSKSHKSRKAQAKEQAKAAKRARQNILRRSNFAGPSSQLWLTGTNDFNCQINIKYTLDADKNVVTGNVSFKFLENGKIQVTENNTTFISPVNLKRLCEYYWITAFDHADHFRKTCFDRQANIEHNFPGKLEEFNNGTLLLNHKILDANNPIEDYAGRTISFPAREFEDHNPDNYRDISFFFKQDGSAVHTDFYGNQSEYENLDALLVAVNMIDAKNWLQSFIDKLPTAIIPNPNATSTSTGAIGHKITRTYNGKQNFGQGYGIRVDRGNGWEEFSSWSDAKANTHVTMGSLRALIGNVRSSGKYAGWKVERM